jgi:outer membrane autotransporter protein
MIRLRSQKLLSGVSTVAVLAAFGIANPALATDQTVTGPGFFPDIDTIVTDTFVLVDTATVDEDALGNSITNTFDVTQAGPTVDITASVLLGNIWNSGTFNSTTATGILIEGNSVVVGGIVNSGGHILGSANGILVDGSDVLGGIQNTGSGSQIVGGTDGIQFTGDSLIIGGISNGGTISGSANGIHFNDALIDFIGDITNSATGRILSTGGTAALNLELLDTFVGDITNAGLISGTGGALGISVASGNVVGDIVNNGTVSSVSGAAVAISLTGSAMLTGNVSNSGLLLASGTAAAGLLINGAVLDGSITNSSTGVISAVGATGIGINVLTGTVTGGISNAGSILATGAGGIGIQVAADGFSGGINNAATGLISADSTAILVSIATFTGDVSNSGSILSATGDGIVLSGSIFDGSVTNVAGALISAANGISVAVTNLTITGDVTNAGNIIAVTDGISLAGGTIEGGVSNSGTIVATSGDGITWTGSLISGDVANSGIITATSGTGIALNGTIIGGDVTNSSTGVITADNGIVLGVTGTITGDLTNAGSIIAATTGISVIGTVSGSLINTGFIDPTIGINVTGAIDGGIFNSGDVIATSIGILVTGEVGGVITNSGTISGDVAGIDLDGADTATDVTQTAGLILGGEGGLGAIGTALTMDNGLADTFTASGGAVDGDIIAGNGDGDNVVVDGAFAWFRGTGTDIDEFNILGGTAVLGSQGRGHVDGTFASDGQGVTLNANSMTLTDGWLYIDDDTTVTLVGALDASGGGGTIEWLLTPTTNGQIVAGTATLAADTRIAAYIDPASFAALQMVVGTAGAITYTNVLTTGGITGTFVNEGTVDMSSPFFTGVATNDGSDVDITIMRNSFATALGLAGATQSANQTSVGTAFESMYLDAGVSADFTDLFTSLFGGDLTTSEIQAVYDDMSGAEHAQLQQTSIRTANMFDEVVGQRLDQTLATETGTGMASLDGQRYAQAAVSASDAMGPGGGSHGLKRGPSGASVWLRGSGQFANVDTDLNAAGYDQDSTGVSGGIDYAVANNATVGLAGHWATSDVDFDTPGDSAEVDSWGAGLYGSYGFGRFYADGLFNYASHDIAAMRTIQAPVLNAPFVALAGYDATTWGLAGEVGMMWRLGRVNMQPSLGLSYTDLSTDGFTETGDAGAYSLIVQGADGQSFTSTVALRASGQWMMGRTPVIPEIKLGWRHEYEDDPLSFNAAFSDPVSPTFTIVSSEIQQDSAIVRAGVTAGVARNFEVFFNVNGQYNSDASATNAAGGLRVTW